MLNRRGIVLGSIASLASPIIGASEPVKSIIWDLGSLLQTSGHFPKIEGNLKYVKFKKGNALEFDGIDDAIFINNNPLNNAKEFSLEAIFCPYGGAFEQRWLHLGTVNGDRIMFEIRVTNDFWYIDTYVKSNGIAKTLITPNLLHPVKKWYHVAQTYDGKTYKCFVNHVLQIEADIEFTNIIGNNSSIGTRMNRRNYFNGAIKLIKFTKQALEPKDFIALDYL